MFSAKGPALHFRWGGHSQLETARLAGACDEVFSVSAAAVLSEVCKCRVTGFVLLFAHSVPAALGLGAVLFLGILAVNSGFLGP